MTTPKSLSWKWREVVCNVQLQARRELGPASQSNYWIIRTEWSSRIPRQKCVQPRNFETKAKTKHYSLRSGLRKYWVNNADHSLCKSAQYLRSSVELMKRLLWKDARSRIYWSEYVHFRRKRKTITTAVSARGWILGKKLAQHTRSRGKLLARTFQQVRNDDSRRTTSHRKRKSRTRQNSLERNALQNMVRMWTMDLGILLRHAESTTYHGPIQILKQNFGFSSTQRLILFLMSKISVITTFMESRFISFNS